MKTKFELTQSGYTPSGAKRYEDTVAAYSEELFSKAIIYAQADKAVDTSLEVGHDHVRSAAHTIASSFGKDRPAKGSGLLQIGEYLLTAAAGVGGGAIKEAWGIPVFTISVALAVVFFVIRTNLLKGSK